MNENGFNTMRTIVDIGLLTEKAKRQVRDMDDEYTELKKKLSVMVDMARVNADRVDALVNAVQHMDANAITGEAPTGKTIVLHDDYNHLVELARSMQMGTPIDGNTHLSGWAIENESLRNQNALLQSELKQARWLLSRLDYTTLPPYDTEDIAKFLAKYEEATK